jgi:hypothetical protein
VAAIGGVPAIELVVPIHQFKLNRPLGLLLNDEGAITDTAGRDYISDLHSHHITAAQLAIIGEVERGSVTPSPHLENSRLRSTGVIGPRRHF